ncbi:MAG: hypothetical protein PHW82_12385 [Bacteroidales bacterium]|nr:hypothetical protein [Bacteroidales bacterium]
MKRLMYLILPAIMFVACNNPEQTKKEVTEDKDCQEEIEQTDRLCRQEAITVDVLLENIEEKVDQEVIVHGKCTHICDHSGKNIFVNSLENEDLVIIGKACEEIEKFDKDLEGKQVIVKGKLIAVKAEEGTEIEVHHDIKMNYYIEVTKLNSCCTGELEGDKTHEHEHEHDCDGEHHHVE